MKIEFEKPVIPEYVAEWIEYRDYYNVYKVLQDLSVPGSPHASKDVRNWIFHNQENVETFVRAWLYGYEIEQEPLYYAKVKGSELIRHDFNKPYWTLEIDDLFISFNGDIDNDEYHTRMTKEEWNKLGINSINADFEEVR